MKNNIILIDIICKWLALSVVVGLLLIVIIQGLLQIDFIRDILVPVEQWEGHQLPFA